MRRRRGISIAAYGKDKNDMPDGGICADFDHAEQYGTFRVLSDDLEIFLQYYGEPNVPCCDVDEDCVLGPLDPNYNFWTNAGSSARQQQQAEGPAAEPVDIQELIKWLEELWLTEQVREQLSEAEWQEFIETVRETPIY